MQRPTKGVTSQLFERNHSDGGRWVGFCREDSVGIPLKKGAAVAGADVEASMAPRMPLRRGENGVRRAMAAGFRKEDRDESIVWPDYDAHPIPAEGIGKRRSSGRDPILARIRRWITNDFLARRRKELDLSRAELP